MERQNSHPNGSRPFLETVLSFEPYYALLFALLPGFGLVFGSILLGIAFVTAQATVFAPVDRQVGYLPAINWSLTYALLFPATAYLITEALRRTADIENFGRGEWIRTTDLLVPKLAASAISLSIKQIFS
jgi:hypothetical protein